MCVCVYKEKDRYLPYIEPVIYAEGKKLDVVNYFVYLGSTITEISLGV